MSSAFGPEAEPLYTHEPPAVYRPPHMPRLERRETPPVRFVHRITRFVLLLAAAAALARPPFSGALPAVSTANSEPVPLTLAARSAILIDQATGRVLFERNADTPLPPASLTKLMTLHLVYRKLEDRSIEPDDVVTISTNAWALHQAPGSSLMNLEPGQIVTVEELMKGMAVASGNDAATALAEYVAGTKEKFVQLMNEECSWFGYKSMHFTDPAGVDESNRVTAREFADFCRHYIELHPQSLSQLLSIREFEYPQPRNLPERWPEERRLKVKPVKQFNGNFLVWNGIDGLKTGHLDEENFTAAITMKEGDTRLIAIVLGVPGRTLSEGYRQRAEDCLALLYYGLRTFATQAVDIQPIKPLRVWKGARETVAVAPSGPLHVTVRKSEFDKISYSIVTSSAVVAPLRKGQKVGDIVFYSGTEEIARYGLQAAEDLEEAGIFKRAWDAVLMSVDTLLGGVG